MKFHDCLSAPSPRRVRIFLKEKSVEIQTVEVDLRNGQHLSQSFKKLNPDCTVPVLELDDGTCISETMAICQYIEAIHPDPCLLGRDAEERAFVTMWNIKIEQQGLLALAEAYRNKANGLRGRALTGPIDYAQIPELVERGQKRAEAFLSRVNEHLSTVPFIAGAQFTMADISMLVMIDFAKWAHVEIGAERTNLQRWYDTVRIRPSVQP